MNLREFIQSEIKSALGEDFNLDQAFNDAEPVEEGVMSELDILAKEAKDLKSFVKTVFKEFDNLPKNKETLKWLEGIYKDSTNEAVNEGTKYKVGQKTPVGKIVGTSVWGKGSKQEWFYDVQKPGYAPKQYSEKSLDKIMGESVNEAKKKLPKFKNIPSWAKYLAQQSDGEWYFYEETPTMIKFKDGSGGAWKQDGNQIYSGVKTDGKDWDKAPTYYNVKNGNITESKEQIDEKLITFSNRAPYGQIVFMAGGAGSGKGFAISNFIDSAGFKVRDVDEMKSAVGKLDQLGKFSVDAWYKKYADKLSEKDRAHVEEFVVGKGMSIADVADDLKNPNNVMSLHLIVDAMGLKDKWLISMLSGKNNKETLPNLLFDITAKKVSSITSVIKPLLDAGYDANNIHLIWVLTDYHLAVSNNKGRDRVVPDDILLGTHEGAAKTIWGILTNGLPKGLNGRIDVILNNRENTVTYKDSKGNKMKGAVKGFLSLPVKKQGGGILPEKVWKKLLYKWISDNGPKTVDLSKPLDRQMRK